MNQSNSSQHRKSGHVAQAISLESYVAVTEAEAARFLGICSKTLRNWRWLRKGPPCVKYGGRGGPVRYVVADLVAYQQAARQRR